MADKKGEVKWIGNSHSQGWKDSHVVVDPKYSKVGERIRHITPSALQCSMFCGGKQCKYDNPSKWKEEEMAIKGLYSSWITNGILAMARPSTYAINEFAIIDQFKKNEISAVINLQHPGEHASCGFGLEDGGFSYVPQQFMDEDVFFYNFCWDDYGVRALQSILDMVKVMDFALMDGKVAIHCHAGLGRTGVLIACYFVYSQRMKGDMAINTVRAKRPRAIQTRGQIACVRDFETYLRPMWIIYSNTSMEHKPFSLSQFLKRQAHILHGEEERDLRYVPKVVFVICQRLLQLAGVEFELKSITVLRRRGFTSLSLTDESAETLLESKGEPEVERKISKEHKNKSDSEFVVGHIFDEEDSNCDLSDASFSGEIGNRVYFDSFEDGPGDGVDMDELVPEQTIRHSVSESVLPTGERERRMPASMAGTTHSVNLPYVPNVTTAEDYTTCDTARTSETDEALTIKMKQPFSLTNDVFVSDQTKPTNENIMKENLDKKRNSRTRLSSTNKSSTKDYQNSTATEEKLSLNNSTDMNNGLLTQDISAGLSPKLNFGRISSKVEKYKNDLNSSENTWNQLAKEENVFLLCCLLWNWLDHLTESVVTESDLETMGQSDEDPMKVFESLDRGKRKTIQVLLLTFLKITSGSEDLKYKALQKISMALTKTTSNPGKSRSEKAALIRDEENGRSQNSPSALNFLNFLEKLSATKLFET